MQLPREPRTGDRVEASTVAQIIRYLRSITPRGGLGVRVSTTANGTTFSAAEQSAGRGGAAEGDHPFKVTDATDATNGRVSVVFGQVNSVTPTIGGTALNAGPDPIVLANGTWVIYLKVTVDAEGLITAAIIDATYPLPANDETYGHLTLAIVTVAANAVTAIHQSVTHSLGHQKCGVEVHNFWGI